MIFTRIRVGWEIFKPWPMGGKYPCVFFLYLTQPPPLKNGCWWLRQLLFWEWGGRTVNPHPHARSTIAVDFAMARETFTHSPLRRPHDCLFTSTHRIYLISLPWMHSPLHPCAEHSCKSNSRPLCRLFIHAQAGSCSSLRMNHCLFAVLMHRYSSVLDSHSELGAVRLHP